MVDKREMEQAQLFETADERGCTPMFGAAHRRPSAVPAMTEFNIDAHSSRAGRPWHGPDAKFDRIVNFVRTKKT